MVHKKRPEDKFSCKKCNSSHIDIYEYENHRHLSCLDCGHDEEYQE